MENLIFFCAHPDDIIGCAGLVLLARERFNCHLVDFTSGEHLREGVPYGLPTNKVWLRMYPC